ncbi:MAG: hypothetical protein U9N57_04335 [Pseudomonadota bacterium]|nr:hypothetical protein [Pseudomonadota bacterium]
MSFLSFKKKPVVVKHYEDMVNNDLGELNTRKLVHEFFLPESIIPELMYWVGPSPILHLPPSMLVMPGGHDYGSNQHPFLQALEGGKDALANFYKGFSPTNLIEMYGIKREGLHGEDLPPWEIPWLLRKRVPPSSEGGLDSSHGASFFGPVTQEKLTLEMRRLESISKSVKAKGYRPKLRGNIEGYFLKNNSEYRFFILGGKHRAAVLSFMGDAQARVPVRVRESVPRFIDRSDSANWPLVRSKCISEELALKVFDCYFRVTPPAERGGMITKLYNASDSYGNI